MASSHQLPDLLAFNLRVIFVGTAAGKRSAELGHYYAGRGNRFWRTLHEIGLTPLRYEPGEFRELLALGIGLTDMSKLGCGMDREVAKHEFNPEQFETNVRRYRPRAVAFTSKKPPASGSAERQAPSNTAANSDAWRTSPRSSSSPRLPAPRARIGGLRPGWSWQLG